MQFDTKIAVAIRTDLEAWQKLNVASFLAGGIAAAFPECIGEPYEDGSGTKYLSLIGQPILIYGADMMALTRALERTLARNVKPAVARGRAQQRQGLVYLSFRGASKTRTRNLEIPRCAIAHLRSAPNGASRNDAV